MSTFTASILPTTIKRHPLSQENVQDVEASQTISISSGPIEPINLTIFSTVRTAPTLPNTITKPPTPTVPMTPNAITQGSHAPPLNHDTSASTATTTVDVEAQTEHQGQDKTKEGKSWKEWVVYGMGVVGTCVVTFFKDYILDVLDNCLEGGQTE